MREPLLLRDVSTRGHDGKRSNVEALTKTLARVCPPGVVYDVAVFHDDACPCADGGSSMLSCTCELVDIRVSVVDHA